MCSCSGLQYHANMNKSTTKPAQQQSPYEQRFEPVNTGVVARQLTGAQRAQQKLQQSINKKIPVKR